MDEEDENEVRNSIVYIAIIDTYIGQIINKNKGMENIDLKLESAKKK